MKAIKRTQNSTPGASPEYNVPLATSLWHWNTERFDSLAGGDKERAKIDG